MKDGRKMRVEAVTDTTFQHLYEGAERQGPYKLQKMVNVNDAADRDEWLEGFGSLNTSVLSQEEAGVNAVERHLLWGENFPIHFFFDNDYLKTQFVEMEEVGDPGEKSPDTIHCEFEGDTLVVSGIVYRTCAGYYYLLCDIQDSIVNFNISEINGSACGGMYCVYARFPGFKEGTYTVVYRGWNGNVIEEKAVCGNTTDIPAIEQDDRKMIWYDLSGRRLSSPPTSGMYIQNGKLVIRK